MPGHEVIVLALVRVAEARQSPGLPQRVELLAPTREQLMNVRLMADVPDDLVLGAVQDEVERAFGK